jgi:hypothetical protein
MNLELLTAGPPNARWTIALAHGAGAGMDSPIMEAMAEGLAGEGVRVVRFEFPYMRRRRESGRKSPPDRAPKLIEAWREVVDAIGPRRLVIGGKSLGGRIASLLADAAGVAGLVCLGYPFHPVGKPDRLRTEHLADLQTQALFVQGERDPFGNRDEVAGYQLSQQIGICWIPDGDHSFKPRKSSGFTLEANLQTAVEAIAEFVDGLHDS